MCPPLQRIEFPWRWLSVVSITGSILVASATEYWWILARKQNRTLFLLGASRIVLPFALTLSQTIRGATYIGRPQFESFASKVAESESLPIWLPVWASKGVRPMPREIEVGDRSLTIDSWEPQRRTFRVSGGRATEARVRTFYYPFWSATAGGETLPVRCDADGAILITLPEDSVSVSLEFLEPTRKEVTLLVSAAA